MISRALTVVCFIITSAFSINVSAQTEYLGEAILEFPQSTLVTGKIGQVQFKWDVPLFNLNQSIVKVEYPKGISYQKVTLAGNDYDEEEGMGTTYNYIIIDLGSILPVSGSYKGYYGDWTITLDEGLVTEEGGNRINPEQTITMRWYKENEDFSVSPNFGSSEDTPAHTSDELKNVRITWEGVTKVERNDEVKGAFIDFYGPGELSLDGKLKVDGEALVVDLSDLEPGKYHVYIPAGYVYLSKTGEEVKQINSEISAYNSWFSLTRGMSSGIVKEPFSPVKGEYPTVASEEKVIEIEYPGQILTLNSGEIVKLYPDSFMDFPPVEIPAENLSVDGGTLKVNYIDNVTLSEDFWSTFRLVYIPEGLVSNESGSENPEQKVMFNVISIIDSKAIWTPKEGGYLTAENAVLTVTWDDILNIGDAYEERPVLRSVNNYERILGWYDYNWNPNGFIRFENGVVKFDLTSLNLSDGEYTIEIPFGSFSIEKANGALVVNDALSHTFKIGIDQMEPNTEVVSEDGTEIHVYWDNKRVELIVDERRPVIIIGDGYTEADPCVLMQDVHYMLYEEGTKVKFDLTHLNLKANTDYSLIIPGGSIRIYDLPVSDISARTEGVKYDENKDIVIPVRLGITAGVEVIPVTRADDLYRVYNLNGICVMTAENETDLYNLPVGLYIINGKKVIVRK